MKKPNGLHTLGCSLPWPGLNSYPCIMLQKALSLIIALRFALLSTLNFQVSTQVNLVVLPLTSLNDTNQTAVFACCRACVPVAGSAPVKYKQTKSVSHRRLLCPICVRVCAHKCVYVIIYHCVRFSFRLKSPEIGKYFGGWRGFVLQALYTVRNTVYSVLLTVIQISITHLWLTWLCEYPSIFFSTNRLVRTIFFVCFTTLSA